MAHGIVIERGRARQVSTAKIGTQVLRLQVSQMYEESALSCIGEPEYEYEYTKPGYDYDHEHAKPNGKDPAVEHEMYVWPPQGHAAEATPTTTEASYDYSYYEHAQTHGGSYQSTTAGTAKASSEYSDGQHGQPHYGRAYPTTQEFTRHAAPYAGGYDYGRIGGDDPGYECSCVKGGVCIQPGGCADALIGGD